MTIYKELKERYPTKRLKTTGSSFRFKPIQNINVDRFLSYWQNADKFMWPGQPWYQGTGLHYNQNLDQRPYASQVCGNYNNHQSYQDTLSFDTPLDNVITDTTIPYSFVRCKITEFSSQTLGRILSRNDDWHRDESPFEALRVIIPLQTAPVYQLQLDNQLPVHLKFGYAYAFDQSQYHRVLSNGVSSTSRVHLILSVVTWYTKSNNQWHPNENFNKVHPLDVFDTISF